MPVDFRLIVEIGIVCFIIVIGVVSGVILLGSQGDVVIFVVENESYQAQDGMDFSSISIDAEYIIFNDTGFYIDSGNDIDIGLSFLTPDIALVGNGDEVLEFSADASGGEVWFNLSGFVIGRVYELWKAGVPVGNDTADGSGVISFVDSDVDGEVFEVVQIDVGSGDSIPPVVANAGIVSSDPVDTVVGFGWENISCDVTDNIGVVWVSVNISVPGGSFDNQTMVQMGVSDVFYLNSTLSVAGDYSFVLWAGDAQGNTVSDSSMVFSMSPNWDIDMSGECTVFDQVLISNQYGETGSLGWVREDVDNNGVVEVLDLVLSSTYYGEEWG